MTAQSGLGTFHVDVVIRRSPADVFAFVAEPRNMPLWYEAVDAVTKTTNGPTTAGTRFSITRSLPGGQDHNDVESHRAPPRSPDHDREHGRAPPRSGTATRSNRTGERTRLTLEGRITSAGLPGPMGRLSGIATQFFERGMQQNLNELKRILEARAG